MEIFGSFTFVSFDSPSQEQLANLRHASFLSDPHLFEKLLEFGIDADTQKYFSRHENIISVETNLLQEKILDAIVSNSYYCFRIETLTRRDVMPSRNKRRSSSTGKQRNLLCLRNTRFARRRWRLTAEQVEVLKDLTEEFQLSIPRGDLLLLGCKWYVTHAGLLHLAQRHHCAGIRVQQVREFCDPTAGRWVFKATLYKRAGTHGFVGFGDADPSNVSSLVQGAEMRVAETRAVNRALRKAYGIGLCSVEELGSLSTSNSAAAKPEFGLNHSGNGSNNGQPRLRDKLCLLIRQYNLDPNLVKTYAADFCGTEKLGDASRETVDSFINLLSKSAKENRDGLVCKLNSYSRPTEVHS
jgi:hypothetical protein